MTGAAASVRLNVDAVSFRYAADAPWAVRDVSFALRAGEVLGLLGPNGAGKSTLMRLIAGVRTPVEGALRRPPAPRFAYVPQDYAFYPTLTCRENLEFFAGVARLNGTRREQQVEKCLGTLALDSFANQRAGECSGGIRRRLNVAIGLLAEPELLLLDEPTANVDPQSRAFLLDLVRSLAGAGASVVYCSHYMEEVQAVCDRVGIIDHGSLLACAPLAELLASGGARELRLRAEGAFDTRLAGLDWRREAGDVWIASLPPEVRLSDVFAQIESADIPMSDMRVGLPDLEDVFLRLTHRALRD